MCVCIIHTHMHINNMHISYKHIRRSIIGIAHVIQQAKSSHKLPFASWRHRKAGDIVGRPETWWVQSVGTRQRPKAWEPAMARSRESHCPGAHRLEEANSPFFHLFVVFLALVGWVMPAHTAEELCFVQSMHSNIDLIWKHPYRFTQK